MLLKTQRDVPADFKDAEADRSRPERCPSDKEGCRKPSAQDRQKADIDIVCVLCAFILKLRHSAHFTHISIAVKNPYKLGMRRNMRLIVKTGLLRVNSRRDI